jgi:pantothenate kinase-related protein Tda10
MGIEVSKRYLRQVSKACFPNYSGVFSSLKHAYLRYLDSYYTYTYRENNNQSLKNKYIYGMSSEKVSKFRRSTLFLLRLDVYAKQCVSEVSKSLRGSLSLVALVGGAGRIFVVPVVGWGL